MKKSSIRIEEISLENFKNVKNGSINLLNNSKKFKSSILGVYGQNGSGKTALVDAIYLLKQILCGKAIESKYAEYINAESDSSRIAFKFNMKSIDGLYTIWYEFSLRKKMVENSINSKGDNSKNEKNKEKTIVEVFDEIIQYSFTDENETIRKNTLIDTCTEKVFVPVAKFLELVGDYKNRVTDLLVNKKFIQKTSRSFIFSGEMINIFRKGCTNNRYLNILERLIEYGHRELFVIGMKQSGLISLDALPLDFKYKDGAGETVGNFTIPLNNSINIPEEMFAIVKKVISNMNIVLEQIVPGLTIDVIDLGTEIGSDGISLKTIQLISLKNGVIIPFKCESDGIKRIVSMLRLLIVVFNNESITVAIDELDAGVFEYLLGELLSIISEKGKGQLIFTSHNLRPLETIDKGFVVFTTTNPNNRYIRFKNVKENNNLRDFYYRDIILGDQEEETYEPTHNSEIAFAFKEAGEVLGS